MRKFAAISIALVAAFLVACGSHNSSGNVVPMNGQIVRLPDLAPGLIATAQLPANTVGEKEPAEGLGTIRMKGWHTVVGGFTQTKYSQTLAFPPGTTITLKNISKHEEHTFDVVAAIQGPPAKFPASPTLSVTAHGNGTLALGYASGPIKPGRSVKIKLDTPGTYLIGCAFHYHYGMRDIIQVNAHAKPGPQATKPAPSPTGSGGSGGGGSGGGGGW